VSTPIKIFTEETEYGERIKKVVDVSHDRNYAGQMHAYNPSPQEAEAVGLSLKLA
jgi:hypothetical protein